MSGNDLWLGLAIGAGGMYIFKPIIDRWINGYWIPPTPVPCPAIMCPPDMTQDTSIAGCPCKPINCVPAMCGPGQRWNWCSKSCVPLASLIPDCPPPAECVA